jgi:TRAP transporter TAXI family solute receptor
MKSKLVLSLLIATTLLLSACSRGPAVDRLQQDLQKRVDTALGNGLLQIKSFRRYGSQPLTGGRQDDHQRVAIYYKAELELLRRHRFSDWSGQNLSALHQVLGSAIKGVEGIAAAGNQLGDVLVAHGLSVYMDENNKWLSVPYQGEINFGIQEADAPGTVVEIDSKNNLTQDPHALWQQEISEQIQQIVGNFTAGNITPDSAILRSDLQSVLTRAKLKQLKSDSHSVLLSGPVAGNYHSFARAVDKVLPTQTDNFSVVPSSGAIENIGLLRDELATFALIQSDLAVASYNGTGVFTGQGSRRLRALAALYPEPVQIAVRSEAGINTLADLATKRVNIGGSGTGTQVNARQILALAKVDYRGFTSMDIGTAAIELMAGRLDALFVTSALPSRYLRGLGRKIKFLPIDAEIISQLSEQHGYVSYKIEPGAYPGVDQAVTTLAVTAMLVANKNASDAKVTALLNGLFEPSSARSELGAQASSLDVSRALDGVAIPLHSAAAEFFDKFRIRSGS